jgi:hypothetical protein
MRLCRQRRTRRGQVMRIIKKWLDANPDKLHWRADTIIHRALLEAFPCN